MNNALPKKMAEEINGIREEMKKKTIGYVIAALGLVCGLAWNEALQGLIDHLFPLVSQNAWVKLLYAALLTLVVAMVSIYLMKLVKTDEMNGIGKGTKKKRKK
jgi:hypothetical protein